MNVLGRVTSGLAHDHVLAFGIPFEHGSGTDAELSPNLGRNRNLALGGNLWSAVYSRRASGHLRIGLSRSANDRSCTHSRRLSADGAYGVD